MHTHILLDRIRGGRCTVLGYGVSNRPLVEWLVRHGAASVTVRDKRDASAMERDGDTARIEAAGASLICGEGYLFHCHGALFSFGTETEEEKHNVRIVCKSECFGDQIFRSFGSEIVSARNAADVKAFIT